MTFSGEEYHSQKHLIQWFYPQTSGNDDNESNHNNVIIQLLLLQLWLLLLLLLLLLLVLVVVTVVAKVMIIMIIIFGMWSSLFLWKKIFTVSFSNTKNAYVFHTIHVSYDKIDFVHNCSNKLFEKESMPLDMFSQKCDVPSFLLANACRTQRKWTRLPEPRLCSLSSMQYSLFRVKFSQGTLLRQC